MFPEKFTLPRILCYQQYYVISKEVMRELVVAAVVTAINFLRGVYDIETETNRVYVSFHLLCLALVLNSISSPLLTS